MDNQKTLLIIGSCIMGFIILLGLAYYLGKQQRVNNEEALRIPIKQLTAEPGTERENAKALLSSQAKIASDTGETISQDKIWGSIENTQQEKVLTRTEQAIANAEKAPSPEEAIQILLDRLDKMEGDKQKSLLYAVLSSYYRALDPPMHKEADIAIERSWRYAVTPIDKVLTAYYQADYHMAIGDYEHVLKDIERIGTDTLPLTEQALQINMMMGIAYEQLSHPEEAKQAYTALMTQANEIGLQQHESVANVYRQAGMKLALMLQKEGKNNEAQALARTVQEAIAF